MFSEWCEEERPVVAFLFGQKCPFASLFVLAGQAFLLL